MGGKGSGRKPYKADIPIDEEKDRAAGEDAKSAWWPLFKPWVMNHLDDPILALEAAFMDGFRQGRKYGKDQ